ncbi:hypothetical protein L596_001453 [Steinernema carpocapsae]|uniref:Uncharacterized protein n=1 Tax=Steinernema carpocapsae TaxID=34508 RepID=A0A4U8ULA8_STECR|nr:hypothetical protein L596_001453 [Steinernema carpocapsae]
MDGLMDLNSKSRLAVQNDRLPIFTDIAHQIVNMTTRNKGLKRGNGTISLPILYNWDCFYIIYHRQSSHVFYNTWLNLWHCSSSAEVPWTLRSSHFQACIMTEHDPVGVEVAIQLLFFTTCCERLTHHSTFPK